MTITHAGNRPVLESEGFYSVVATGFPNQGAVNYEYRIARTETTNSHWIDFVRVFTPFADQLGISRNSSAFTGGYITASNLTPGTAPGWFIPGAGTLDNVAIAPSLRFAARYINWTEHGQPTTNITLDTFHTGAYDIETLTRQPGAQYWIPSLDEWTKAVYYDPNRYGPGQEGYWQYSGMSMIPLVGGAPGTPGAQTSGSGWNPPGGAPPPPVGAYPQTRSPWGLLDTSGGEQEWTDTPTWFGVPNHRLIRGDAIGGLADFDRVDFLFGLNGYDSGGTGLRIASLVPAPASAALPLSAAALVCARRRRRM